MCDDSGSCRVGVRPVGGADRVKERLDVGLLPVEDLGAARIAMPGMQGRSDRELFTGAGDVRQPLFVKSVGQVTVMAVIGEIAREDLPVIVLQRPDAVVRRLAGPEVGDSQVDPV